MVTRVHSFLLAGIEAHLCEVEVHVVQGDFESEIIVGLPDTAVRESLQRVKAALSNSGYPVAVGKVLINLAPADVRKQGPVYDLPIAIGMLQSLGVLDSGGRGERSSLDPVRCLLAGELALDGRVRPIRGAIALADLARQRGFESVIVPSENAREAAVVDGVDVYGAGSLSEVVGLLTGALDAEPTPPIDVASMVERAEAPIDFAEVRGQESVKRALIIAAAGGHNILMLGPAGTGKSMMAKALPGILAPLTPTEAIEVTRLYSAAGQLDPGQSLITTRPVRTPHHTASSPAIVGGGKDPTPGEISLAHHGVLFLDELPEFPRAVLETLRQPLEDQVVTIARASATMRFPASFMLVGAMNPTPRGDVAPGEVGRREMERYLSRISGPLFDRIDLHIEVPGVPFKELTGAPRGTNTASMRAEVLAARAVQHARQGKPTNARLSGKQLDQLAKMDEPTMALLGEAIQSLGLSARAYDKIRRVARTIADLAGAEKITNDHVAEAVQYRQLDRRV